MKKKNINYDELLESWPSPFVARCKIEEFTKGLYKGGSMKTFDGSHKGISNRYRFGTKVFYKAVDVVNWLKVKRGN